MGANSKIEWTDHTFNPWIGCTKVSPGCTHCYAETEAKYRGWAIWGKGKTRMRTSPSTWKNPIQWNRQAQQERQRKRVFCASLADVFDAEIDPEWRSDLWEVVRNTPFLDWLLLTKRPEKITKMLPADWGDGWPNVCLMTSVEDQLRSNRVEILTSTPARFRALSVEPLLGPVKLKPEWLKKLDWVIVGGESGGHARPMHPDWARALRDQCAAAKVKFLFKQWGCWTPDEKMANDNLVNASHFADATGVKPTVLGKMKVKERRQFQSESQGGTWIYHTAKETAGNKLDGHRHLENPFGGRISEQEIIVPLDAAEHRELAECEATIRRGLGAFVEVGQALATIRDSRLYREKFGTFEEYVQSVMALGRSQAYNLMGSAEVIRDLSTIVDKSDLPANEAQARELISIKTPEKRVEAWKKVRAAAVDSRPITALFIRKTLSPSTSDPKSGSSSAPAKNVHPTLKNVLGMLKDRPGFSSLPQEEKDKLKAASEKAQQDTKVQAARAKMEAAAKEMREAMNAALVAADSSVEPILKKLEEAREKPMNGRDSRPRGEGEQPPK